MCAYNFKYTMQCRTSHSPHSISMLLQHNYMRKSHHRIVGRELSYVKTVRATEENLMLFIPHKIVVGKSYSTPTNQSRAATARETGKETSFEPMVPDLWFFHIASLKRIFVFVNHVKTKTNSLKPRLGGKRQNKHCQEASKNSYCILSLDL